MTLSKDADICSLKRDREEVKTAICMHQGHEEDCLRNMTIEESEGILSGTIKLNDLKTTHIMEERKKISSNIQKGQMTVLRAQSYVRY